jgi:hypothetical protein
MAQAPRMTGHDFVRLSAASIVDVKTVKRAYDTKKGGYLLTRPATRERLRIAAMAIGLPLPPEPT